MKRPLLVVALLSALLSSAIAADGTVPGLGNATSVAGSDGLYCVQSSGAAEKQCLASQVAAYVYGLMSGDGTTNGSGAFTLGNTGVTPGTYTNVTLTVDLKGRITSISTSPTLALNGATIGSNALAVNGSASFTGGVGTPTFNLFGSTSGNTSLIGPAVGASNILTLPNITGTLVAANDNIAFTGNNSFSGTSLYTGALPTISVNGQGGIGATATGGLVIQGQGSTNDFTIFNKSGASTCGIITGTLTWNCAGAINAARINVTASTLPGNGMYLPAANTVGMAANTTLVQSWTSAGTAIVGNITAATLDTAGAVAGSLCATSAGLFEYKVGVNCFSATQTIFHGTATMGTALIASGACATTVTVPATGVLTTDTIQVTSNVNLSTVTGFLPLTTGGLEVSWWPTAGNINIQECNPTAGSLTPGAHTFNLAVVR